MALTRAHYAALIVVSDPERGTSPVTRAILESADPRLMAASHRLEAWLEVPVHVLTWRERQGRIDGAEDRRSGSTKLTFVQQVAAADVVIAEHEEPPAPGAAPEGAHRRRLRRRMQHVAHAE